MLSNVFQLQSRDGCLHNKQVRTLDHRQNSKFTSQMKNVRNNITCLWAQGLSNIVYLSKIFMSPKWGESKKREKFSNKPSSLAEQPAPYDSPVSIWKLAGICPPTNSCLSLIFGLLRPACVCVFFLAEISLLFTALPPNINNHLALLLPVCLRKVKWDTSAEGE